MGKKQNQHQRTKGNLQASSSSRAAQLLQSRNAPITPVVGFAKDNHAAENAANVDSILSTSFRKLGKKESVTKQKALSEILDSVCQENIGGCLILWARFFGRISIDNDRKIRELSQAVHSKIVGLSGRELAPFLNTVMGPWLEGTCDVHSAAAETALTSLRTAFPGDKLRNAISYCEHGLAKHLKDRLGSSPSTLSDMKITDPVDAEEKYSRVIGSTLRMFAFLLQTHDKLEAINLLFHDNILWSLGRSKVLQVRKHMFTFISAVSKESSYNALPEVAYKIVTQQLNTCKLETVDAQYDALKTVMSNNPERFWSAVSVSDVRGQLLDTIKSKALLGGVLQTVMSHMPVIVTVFYNHWIVRGTSNAWYGDVLTNAAKCLSQCKLEQDKVTIVRFIARVAVSIRSTYNDQLVPNPSIHTVCSMIANLTSSTLTPSIMDPLESFLKHLTYDVITCRDVTSEEETEITHPTSIFLLQSVKKVTDTEITNTLILIKMLLNIRPTDRSLILTHLAMRCEQSIGWGGFEYASRLLAEIPGLSDMLFVKVTRGDNSELALINLTNSLFIPHFSNTSYRPYQIENLSSIVIRLLPHGQPPYTNIVQALITQSCHSSSAFLTFLKEQVCHPTVHILSAKFMCETFDSLPPTQSPDLGDIITSMVDVSVHFPEVADHFVSFIHSSVTSSRREDKYFTLLKSIKWTPVYVDSIKLIIDNITTYQDMESYTPALRNMMATNPRFAGDVIQKMIKTDGITVNEMEVLFNNIFGSNIALVLEYCNKHLPIPAMENSALMELYEEFSVLNVSELCYGSVWSDCDRVLLKSTLNYLNQFSFEEQLSDYVCMHLSRILVLDFLLNKTAQDHLANRLRQRAPDSMHVILAEVMKNHGMLVVYVLNNLAIHDFEIRWNEIDDVVSLPLESLVVLSANFHLNLTDVLRKKGIDSSTDLCYMTHTARHADHRTLSAIVNSLLELYLGDIESLTLKDLAMICQAFSNIAQCNSATDECMEFVLCSTATIIQAALDTVVDAKFDLEEQFFFSAMLSSFSSLYNTLLSVTQSDMFDRFREDWDHFFEPGIQDLVLLLHDRILSSPLKSTVEYLSPIVTQAPLISVKNFMKQVLKDESEISFDQCLRYLMGFYDQGAAKTRTALFSLLLRCQTLFELEAEVKLESDSEDAQFDSPPTIYLNLLEEVDLVNFATAQEYEERLLKATQIWILLLLTEAKVAPEILREHVEFLRSKQILSDFLDNLVYLIRFSSKKYSIVPMDKICDEDGFEAHKLASTCLMGIASIFPALLRSWWKRLDKEMTISVERFVKSFISPTLIKVETSIRTNPDDETLLIKARPVVKEVIATYTMDDITADLIINIANNHPLTPPTVSCERQVGVPVSVWRSWMLQMTSMFQNQNSSIVHALEHWRTNMDKQFEGLESCMICFSMVQGKKKALPKPSCKTCKKSFHSACLYKWFSTSGKSTCPMCRSVFQHSTGLRARLQEEPVHE